LKRIPALLEDVTIALPELVRQTVWEVLQETHHLEARIATIDQQLARVVREHAVARRLVQIPGVGVITATALLGAVGHIHAFRRSRHFASWLGLTPRESSSGGRRRLGGHQQTG
jgi:transposase